MKIKFKLAQINLFVGNFKQNYNKIKSIIEKAVFDNTDILIFPELAITGYPPEDLLYKNRFINENLEYLKKISLLCKNIICIIGFVNKERDNIYNSAAVICNKKICAVYNKRNLPNYSVFDEKRYFKQGEKDLVIDINNLKFSISICEDLWADNDFMKKSIKKQSDFIININASPYYIDKYNDRIKLLKNISKSTENYIFYLNLIGGQDEIVFDGNSLVFNNNGKLICSGKQFEEDIIDIVIDFKEKKKTAVKNNSVVIKGFKFKNHKNIVKQRNPVFLNNKEEIYKALVLGTKDYIKKNNFKKVIIGLSGGVDSALTAMIAVDALGSDNVQTIFMPTKFSSKESYIDAKELAGNLKIKFDSVPIKKLYADYLNTLNPFFKNLPFSCAEENIQARIRGNILMAFSNKFGHLVLTTGNKSEMSTGYATLYGDMAGGFSVLKDIYKTIVYDLVEFRNNKEGYDIIPGNIITKAPTAELKENQKDSDSLPDYNILDKILYLYIEKHLTYSEIIKDKKLNEKVVEKVINLVDRSEYKRRQAPPGLKITKLSFGKDRRMPITNGYVLR